MSVRSHSARSWEPYAGLAYVVLFLGGILVSSPPADKASAEKWVANYTGVSQQARHVATGFLLLLAGLALMTFLVALWRRIADADPDVPTSPLPIAAASVAAACMAAGGMVMSYISGGQILGDFPLPSVDLLRLSNDLGFALAGVAGGLSAGVAVAGLSLQGHRAGVFSTRMRNAGLATSVILVLSPMFIPIVALLAWVFGAAISWIRQLGRTGEELGAGRSPSPLHEGRVPEVTA